jgi:hypothetical protein
VSGVSPADFDRLLGWLHPERNHAGRIYEEIRRKMIRFFICRGCTDPDSLTDSTIDRVNSVIVREGFRFDGEPLLFFYGVARNVCHEWQRQAARPMPQAADLYIRRDDPLQYDCLESCIKELAFDQRDLILSYYRYEPGRKGECREQLAQRYGLGVNALRIRVHRIRTKLRECIEECVRINNSLQ